MQKGASAKFSDSEKSASDVSDEETKDGAPDAN